MLKRGFTLVELLIVIALLSAIALVVIAAINPIEQANRARDTRFRADGAQLISGIERYFAARQQFPWVTTNGTTYDNDSSFGFTSAGAVDVGICGDAGCGTDGELIKSLELKTEFRNRDFVTATTTDKQLRIGKGQGTSESVYACFIPASKSERDKAVAEQKVYTVSATDGTRTATTACDGTSANWITNSCHVCVPE